MIKNKNTIAELLYGLSLGLQLTGVVLVMFNLILAIIFIVIASIIKGFIIQNLLYRRV